jgi:hypothetical protein
LTVVEPDGLSLRPWFGPSVVVASVVPARRATRIDLTTALAGDSGRRQRAMTPQAIGGPASPEGCDA